MSAWQWVGVIIGIPVVGWIVFFVVAADYRWGRDNDDPWWVVWIYGWFYLAVAALAFGVVFGIPTALIMLAAGEWVPF